MYDLVFKGFWKTPATEDCIAGTLVYNEENGIELELFGSFKDKKNEIILGYSKDRKPITLVNCFTVSINLNSSITKIAANIMIVGSHFTSIENIKFNAIAYNSCNLEEWFWSNNFYFKESEDKYILEYYKPKSHLVSIDTTHNLRLYTKTKLPPLNSIPYYKATIEETTFISIECVENNSETLEILLKYKNQMDSFLTLAIGSPQRTKEIHGFSDEKETDIYIQPYNIIKNQTILPPNMFINYHWYESRFDVIIKRWFERYEVLEDIFDMYFSLLLQNKPYTQQRFLFRIQVLESYHRKTHINDKLISSNKKYIKELINKLSDKEDKRFLKEKLSFAHEPSLNNRLIELLNQCAIIEDILEKNWSGDEVQKMDDISTFAKAIRDTRNYFTHYDKSLSKKAMKGLELHNASEKLDIIIRYYIYIELGFSPDECRRIFNDIYHFSYRELLDDKS